MPINNLKYANKLITNKVPKYLEHEHFFTFNFLSQFFLSMNRMEPPLGADGKRLKIRKTSPIPGLIGQFGVYWKIYLFEKKIDAETLKIYYFGSEIYFIFNSLSKLPFLSLPYLIILDWLITLKFCNKIHLKNENLHWKVNQIILKVSFMHQNIMTLVLP